MSALDECEAVSAASAVQVRFRKLFAEAFDGLEPSMGGSNVGDFPRRLMATAEARGLEPLELLEQAFAAWVRGGCEGRGKATAYSAFVARFEVLVSPAKRSNGRARSSPAHEFEPSDLNLLGPPAPGEAQ